ncbi:MAG: hypothetical protein ACAH83_10660 [Alphaproteobacteria bacterium]
MPNFRELTRLKDEFALAAQLRPATAEHYAAWLEEYLDKGGDVKDVSVGAFPKEKFFTVSADATLPPLEGGLSLNIIVPPGVNLNFSTRGNCGVYSTDGGQVVSNDSVAVWTEMLDMLIRDGYPLARLVRDSEMGACAQVAIINSIMEKDVHANDFYEVFANDATLETTEARLKKMQALDVDGIMRDFLKLKKDTPIDAVSQRIIDRQAQAAVKVLQVLRYKLDPASLEPIAAFGKRAKPVVPEEPSVELRDGIQIGPPLKYREQRSPKA